MKIVLSEPASPITRSVRSAHNATAEYEDGERRVSKERNCARTA